MHFSDKILLNCIIISAKPEEVEEISLLLDSIYGKTWREKQDQILPKTEPRKNHRNHHTETHSER